MARFVSRIFGMNELVPAPSPPSGPELPVGVPALAALRRVPFLAWLGLSSLLLFLSVPLGIFVLASLVAWKLLSRMIASPVSRRLRRWQADRSYWQALDEPGRIGLRGERKVLRSLAKLPDDYIIFHDLTVPTKSGSTQVDVVLLAPDGLVCLEVKAWAGGIYGQEAERTWTQVKHYGGKEIKQQLENPVQQNAYHCQTLASHLAENRWPARVGSLIVFTRGDLRTTTTTPVVPLSLLRSLIEVNRQPATLTPEQITGIARYLTGLLTEPLAPPRAVAAEASAPSVAQASAVAAGRPSPQIMRPVAQAAASPVARVNESAAQGAAAQLWRSLGPKLTTFASATLVALVIDVGGLALCACILNVMSSQPGPGGVFARSLLSAVHTTCMLPYLLLFAFALTLRAVLPQPRRRRRRR